MTIVNLEKRNDIKMEKRNSHQIAVWSTRVSKEGRNGKLTKQEKNKGLVSREHTENVPRTHK